MGIRYQVDVVEKSQVGRPVIRARGVALKILSEERRGRIAEMQIRHELRARDTELQLLRSEAKITQLKQYGLFGALASLLVVILMLVNRYRLKVRSSRVIEEQKQRLEETLAEITVLRGLLPICSECKMIRDEAGAWCPLEVYISDRSEAKFTHGLCPECVARLYPELNLSDLGEENW